MKEQDFNFENRIITDVGREIRRVQDAVFRFEKETNIAADQMEETVGKKDADILRGHILILQNLIKEEAVTECISRKKISAEMALSQALKQIEDNFSQIPDEVIQQRAADIYDIRMQMIRILSGIEETDVSQVPKGTILVAKDMTPSMMAAIVPENIRGILAESGSRTSHSAILARAMEIPAVFGVEGICNEILKNRNCDTDKKDADDPFDDTDAKENPDGADVHAVSDGAGASAVLDRADIHAVSDDTDAFEDSHRRNIRAVLDGTIGEVVIYPDEETVEEFKQRHREYQNEKESLKDFIRKDTVTRDGKRVRVLCNIEKPEDAKKVVRCGGEGIGLFRTEFLFMNRETMPTEEEQFEIFKSIAETMKDRPAIIRLPDIGGDKELSCSGISKEGNSLMGVRGGKRCNSTGDIIKEDNPLMGVRGVRFCLQRTDILKTQLRALLRASAFGKIKIMVPLVTGVGEFRQVKAIVKEIMKSLDSENVLYYKNIEIGVMMETPAACMVADALAKEAAFFSIGTNDLIGYTMAADRGNRNVANLYSAYNPAVLRSIKQIIECGKREGIIVGMCGEAAEDPRLIPVFLAFGLDEFSVGTAGLLRTKKVISDSIIKDNVKLTEKIMQCVLEEDVLKLL